MPREIGISLGLLKVFLRGGFGLTNAIQKNNMETRLYFRGQTSRNTLKC